MLDHNPGGLRRADPRPGAIGFNLTIARSGGTCVYTGAITGSFALSQTIKIQARALLPLGQGLITVTARSDAPLPTLGTWRVFSAAKRWRTSCRPALER